MDIGLQGALQRQRRARAPAVVTRRSCHRVTRVDFDYSTATAYMHLDTEDIDGETRVIRIQGRLDAPAVDRLESKFNAAVAAGGHHALVDLTQVDFIASLGLRMFIVAVRAAGRKGRQIVFYGAQPAVRQVLEHSAFEKIAPVAADLRAAQALLRTS